ncbi:MAG: SsrA-binding protein SmpB [Candidatus Kaiserbacteria bacterium]|nr:SsrA-binding protein SmpB [Candidatus Kaiserbacteria bacterium]
MAYITNRNIRQHYEILDTLRAGLSLLGTEVKSIRTGQGSLAGAKIFIRGDEAFLIGATIPAYQPKNIIIAYEEDRPRRLLLNKNEIRRLYTSSEEKQLTLVPLTIYNCNRKLKLDIGVANKKTKRDKREEIKKRDSDRSIRRLMRQSI